MILTAKARQAIIDGHEVRLKLAIALKFTEFWVNQLVEKNKVNGPLTTHASTKVISEETGLTDSEILEDEILQTANVESTK